MYISDPCGKKYINDSSHKIYSSSKGQEPLTKPLKQKHTLSYGYEKNGENKNLELPYDQPFHPAGISIKPHFKGSYSHGGTDEPLEQPLKPKIFASTPKAKASGNQPSYQLKKIEPIYPGKFFTKQYQNKYQHLDSLIETSDSDSTATDGAVVTFDYPTFLGSQSSENKHQSFIHSKHQFDEADNHSFASEQAVIGLDQFTFNDDTQEITDCQCPMFESSWLGDSSDSAGVSWDDFDLDDVKSFVSDAAVINLDLPSYSSKDSHKKIPVYPQIPSLKSLLQDTKSVSVGPVSEPGFVNSSVVLGGSKPLGINHGTNNLGLNHNQNEPINIGGYDLIRRLSKTFAKNSELAKNLKATGLAIAGHGALEKNYQTFVLPDNIELRTFRIPGQTLDDRVGIHIEAGHIDYLEGRSKYSSSIFKKTFESGQEVPNYIIHPPDEKINPLIGSITVDKPTYLSDLIYKKSAELLQSHSGRVTLDLATCQSCIIPKIEDDYRENISARLEILNAEIISFLAEYGSKPPPKIVNYLKDSANEIEQDVETLKSGYKWSRLGFEPKYLKTVKQELKDIRSKIAQMVYSDKDYH